MKKTIRSLFLAAGIAFHAHAQVVLHEPFNAPFNPTAAGWDVQNLSAPAGTATWFQGNNSFNALVGGPTDYYAVNFNSTANTGANNTISNWLITPTLNLVNGAIIQFATRTAANSAFADRLQLYYSTAGNGTNVGNSAGTATNAAGTFTNILMDINTAQNVAGYPPFWVVMTVTINNLPAPAVGRLAFRYFLTNAGAGGTTGNFIGIDEFRYSLPCNHVPFNVGWTGPGMACTGNSITLMTAGNATTAINSFTWITGANTSTTAVVPPVSGINSFYVLVETTPGCVDLDVANINVFPSPTVAFSYVPNGHICSGTTVTLTSTGATSYTYVLSPTVSSTVNPIALNAPTVTALTPVAFIVRGRGANNCVNTRTVNLVIDPNPTVTVTGPATALCVGSTATLGATGAFNYTWTGAGSATTKTLSYTAAAPVGTRNFTLQGTSIEGCRSAEVVTTVTVTNCSTVGIEEQAGKESTVYPNPFSSSLHFESFNGKVTIYNELGQLMMEHKADESQTIDTALWPSGVYLLKLSDASGNTAYRRMVKQ